MLYMAVLPEHSSPRCSTSWARPVWRTVGHHGARFTLSTDSFAPGAHPNMDSMVHTIMVELPSSVTATEVNNFVFGVHAIMVVGGFAGAGAIRVRLGAPEGPHDASLSKITWLTEARTTRRP